MLRQCFHHLCPFLTVAFKHYYVVSTNHWASYNHRFLLLLVSTVSLPVAKLFTCIKLYFCCWRSSFTTVIVLNRSTLQTSINLVSKNIGIDLGLESLLVFV